MPSENYKTKRYEPVPVRPNDTQTTPYGGGVHEGDHPPLPAVPDFRDDTRAAEVGGIRSRYKTRNWPDRIDQSALAKIRRDLLSPRVTSK